MRLTTRILDDQGEPISYYLTKFSGETLFGRRTDVKLYVNGKCVGFMKFSIQEDCLYIHRMYNYTVDSIKPYKHIGYLLFEYAFHKSIKAGKGGNIELDAIDASPAAYYRMGLRKQGSARERLKPLIAKYWAVPSTQAQEEIEKHNFYKLLKIDAAENLKKDIDVISFEEALKYGMYSSRNALFEIELGKKKPLTKSDCICLSMHGMMYLPPEIIEQKKIEFARFVPIGSNLFFSQTTAEARLQNGRLKELVKAGKLDPSNAVEIEAKLTATDPILDVLLSPIGLKMMKRNWISGWYIGVYFADLATVQAIISEHGVAAFELGYVKNINVILNMSNGIRKLILSEQGIQALKSGEIVIAETGYIVKDKHGKPVDYDGLMQLLTVKPLAAAPK